MPTTTDCTYPPTKLTHDVAIQTESQGIVEPKQAKCTHTPVACLQVIVKSPDKMTNSRAYMFTERGLSQFGENMLSAAFRFNKTSTAHLDPAGIVKVGDQENAKK